MSRRGYFIRLAISVAIDVIDFTFGRVPGIGSIEDGLGVVVLVGLWGPVGLLSLWEVAEVTEFVDANVPSATLIALAVGWKKGFIGKKAHPAPAEPRNVTPAPRQIGRNR